MKRTFSGPAAGKGAVYEWDGNKNVGKGRMEITEVSPPSKVKIKLDFLKPFEAHNTAEFTLEPRGDATDVTWAMYGPNLFIGKLMSVFIEHGPHGRQGLRDRSRQPEGDGRKLRRRPSGAHPWRKPARTGKGSWGDSRRSEGWRMSGASAASGTMRAAVLTGPGQVRIERSRCPSPGRGRCGCGSRAAASAPPTSRPGRGPEWMSFPTEPGGLGHEGWGVVDAVGEGVDGSRPATAWRRSPQHAYAEYDLAEADAVVQLPAALDGQPFPGEPLGCAMNIFRRSGDRGRADGGDRRHRLSRRAADAARGRCRRAGDRDLAAPVLARGGAADGRGRDDRDGRPLARSSRR